MEQKSFPSPCGVRRVRDANSGYADFAPTSVVSVPLRGKEGARHGAHRLPRAQQGSLVSVPLRGKEGGEKKKKEERRMKTGC